MSEDWRIPEPYASVVRLQVTGVPDVEIAAELDLPISEVERLGREGQRIGSEIMTDPEFQAESARRRQELSEQSARSVDRPASARDLLETGSFLTVERGDDSVPELLPDAFVWFSDIAVHDFDDLVDETVMLLRGRADVQSADRQDRELIVITGTVEITAIEADLQAWWRVRLHDEASA